MIGMEMGFCRVSCSHRCFPTLGSHVVVWQSSVAVELSVGGARSSGWTQRRHDFPLTPHPDGVMMQFKAPSISSPRSRQERFANLGKCRDSSTIEVLFDVIVALPLLLQPPLLLEHLPFTQFNFHTSSCCCRPCQLSLWFCCGCLLPYWSSCLEGAHPIPSGSYGPKGSIPELCATIAHPTVQMLMWSQPKGRAIVLLFP